MLRETDSERIEYALKHLRSKVSIPDSAVSCTSFNGRYSSHFYKRNSKDQWVFYVRITPFVSGINSERTEIVVTVPVVDHGKERLYENAIRQCLEKEYALVPYDQALNDTHLTSLTHGLLAEAATKYPSEFSDLKTTKSQIKGLFLTNLIFPTDSEKNHSISIEVRLRSSNDYDNQHSCYLLKPAKFFINTGIYYNEKAPKEEKDEAIANANLLKDKVNIILESLGLLAFDLRHTTQQVSNTREIPKHWINLDHVEAVPSRTGIYKIMLVSRGERYPQIPWSTGTRDSNVAKQMQQAIVQKLLPLYLPGGAHENESFSLDTVSNFIRSQEHFVADEKPSVLSPKKDVRIVSTGNDDAIRLLTPTLTPYTTGYTCTLRFSPMQAMGVVRELDHPLNTSSLAQAEMLRTRLQTAVQLSLQQYFNKHTTQSLVTETSSKGKKSFRIAKPGENAPEDQIFLRDVINKAIKPVLETFNRDIYWRTEITPSKNNMYEVRCQVRRNENNEVLAEKTSPFQGPFSVVAKDQQQAEAFAAYLEEALMREQYLFSRDRQVIQFGQASTQLVIKESLNQSLRAFPEVTSPDTVLFKTLIGRDKK